MNRIIGGVVAALALAAPLALAGPSHDPPLIHLPAAGQLVSPAPTVYFVAPDAPVAVVRIPVVMPSPNRLGEAFLKATRMRESGGHSGKIGHKGERGAYQFRYITWRQYSHRPFRDAHTAAADTVAHRHLEWISEGLARLGLAVTPYRLAVAWNAGLDALERGQISPATIEYATAVAALTECYLQGSS